MFTKRIGNQRARKSIPLLETLECRTLLSAALLPQTASSAISFVGASDTAPPVAAAPISVVGHGVTLIPLTIQALTGVAYTGDVGLIKGLSPSSLHRLNAQINWGDSIVASPIATYTPGTLTFDSAGVLHVGGSHTFTREGTFPITINVTLDPPGSTLGPTQLFTIHSTAVVTGNSQGGVTLYEAPQVQFTALVGRFNVPPTLSSNTLAPVLKATINWGDGTSTAGKIVYLPISSAAMPFPYGVQGTHTYATAGIYPITVAVYQQYLPVGPLPISVSPISASPLRLITTIHSTADVVSTTPLLLA